MKKLAVVLLNVFFIIWNVSADNTIEIITSSDKELKVGADLSGAEAFLYADNINPEMAKKMLDYFRGTYSRLEPGKPDLPALSSWMLIPNGAGFSLNIIPGDPIVITDFDLLPVEEDVSDNTYTSTVTYAADSVIYGTDADYPGILSEMGESLTIHGQECSVLWIYPFQYNPVSKILSVYPDLTVNINFDDKREPLRNNLISESFDQFFRVIAINAEEILSVREILPQTDGPSDNLPGAELLIISDPLFEEAANKLANWRNANGVTAKTVLTTETGPSRENIEEYIDFAYKNWNPAPTYLLLFGDAEHIPTWYVHNHPSGDKQGKIGSDIYYGDVDEYYGNPMEDIFLGRIPVDTYEEAMGVIDKIITYETTDINDAVFSRVSAAGFFQDDDNNGYEDRRYLRTSLEVSNFLESKNINTDKLFYAMEEVEPLYWSSHINMAFNADVAGQPIPESLRKPNYTWDAGAKEIINSIEEGRFLFIHRDHGYRKGWFEPAFSVNDFAAFGDKNFPPIVWSINCETGWFDNESDSLESLTFDDEESLAEEFLRNSVNGAAGVMASSRISYSPHNDRMIWGFMNAIWPDFINYNNEQYIITNDPILEMGGVLTYGKIYLYQKNKFTNVVRTQIESYHWLGDPSMKIRFNSETVDSTELPFNKNSSGALWITPEEKAVNIGDHFETSILINTGTQEVKLFDLDITYKHQVIDLDLSKGVIGLFPSDEVVISTIGNSLPGVLNVRGSIATAGNSINFLTIYWIASGIGESSIELTINELIDRKDESYPLINNRESSISVVDFLLGDVNDDGLTDVLDAMLVMQYSVGMNPGLLNPKAGDVNLDGSIDTIDAMLIARYSSGLITEF